jgi:hypothetical protein
VLLQVGGQQAVAVDGHVEGGAGTELLVAEGVIEVSVGVHQHPNACGSEDLQVGLQFGRLRWRRTTVDHQQFIAAADYTDVDREVLIGPHVHLGGHLTPARERHPRRLDRKKRFVRPMR